MEVQPKRILSQSKVHKGEIFEQFFSKKSDYLQNNIADKIFLTVYEMYKSELVVNVDQVKDHFVPFEISKESQILCYQ